jgi:hypothetical protein
MEIYRRVFIGIGLILLGMFFTWYTYKHPNLTFKTKDVGGYIGGIGLIILGIMEMFGQIDVME